MRSSRSRTLACIGIATLLLCSQTLPALARGGAAAGTGGTGAAGTGATGASGSGASGTGANGTGASGTGTSTGGTGSGGSSGPARGNSDAETSVFNLSQSAQKAIEACDLDRAQIRCVADVLDKFAVELAEIAPQLPPSLRRLPEIVATSARKLRAARTKTEAVIAIKEAIAVVHKTIALLTADDPVGHQIATREGASIATTLAVADAKLEKAVGL
jgi:hypothetical protein